MNKTKPFCISKRSVMAAWESVKANKGACGVDEESITDFELNLKSNLYKLWNRMSSGTYFPSPVKGVEIAKPDGRKRLLGIPTISDRIAQTVIKSYLEPVCDPIFHEDSFGFRPKKSALDAVGKARQRCWRQDWCIDLDIEQFFDNIDHELMLKAIKFHTNEKWIHLYAERCLKAPLQLKDGQLIERNKGASQGGVTSPLFANIFMHHVFDNWMKRNYPEIKFERYADDAIVHCSSLKQAEKILEVIRDRLKECHLRLHPEKTKIVYCKDADRKGSYKYESFDFLGYTFRPRSSMNKYGKIFVNFTPAISDKAANNIRREIRSWRIQMRSSKSLTDLAKIFNVHIQGWVNYYGKYNKSTMNRSIRNMEHSLVRWAMRKYKRFRRNKTKATEWLGTVRKRDPRLFVHWKLGLGS